jgi:single-stranded DNA-binding protein
MAYINQVFISGNVGKVEVGETKTTSSAAASMVIAVENSVGNYEPSFVFGNTVWVRVNCYGTVAKLVAQNVSKGDYVIVWGRLMSRRLKDGSASVIEVKAHRVEVIKKGHRVSVPKE